MKTTHWPGVVCKIWSDLEAWNWLYCILLCQQKASAVTVNTTAASIHPSVMLFFKETVKSPSKQHPYYPLCSWALQSWHTHFVLLLNISMAAAAPRLRPDLSVNIALYCTVAWTDRALLCCSIWEMAACPGWRAEQRKRKKNNSLLLRNRSVPLNKLTLWHFKLLSFWFLRCWMQEELFIKHTRVVTWQQKCLSDFLGTLSVERKSQTMQHSGQKNQLIHSIAALNYICD